MIVARKVVHKYLRCVLQWAIDWDHLEAHMAATVGVATVTATTSRVAWSALIPTAACIRLLTTALAALAASVASVSDSDSPYCCVHEYACVSRCSVHERCVATQVYTCMSFLCLKC